MVIDFHVHCFPDEIAPKAVPALAEVAHIEARLDGTVDGVRRSMETAGIDCSVILSIATKPSQTEKVNNWSAGIQDKGIIPFGSIHPQYSDWKNEMARIKRLGLKGIKFHPDYQEFFVDDPGMLLIYEYAMELGLIIVFHAGVDIGLPPPVHCTPERLRKVARLFPGGGIVAAHMGGYGSWDDVENYLVGEDIYFDTAYSFKWMEEDQIKRIIKNHGYEKILFATDSPWTDQSEELSRLRKLNLGHEIENAILGENSRALLGLQPGDKVYPLLRGKM